MLDQVECAVIESHPNEKLKAKGFGIVRKTHDPGVETSLCDVLGEWIGQPRCSFATAPCPRPESSGESMNGNDTMREKHQDLSIPADIGTSVLNFILVV